MRSIARTTLPVTSAGRSSSADITRLVSRTRLDVPLSTGIGALTFPRLRVSTRLVISRLGEPSRHDPQDSLQDVLSVLRSCHVGVAYSNASIDLCFSGPLRLVDQGRGSDARMEDLGRRRIIASPG